MGVLQNSFNQLIGTFATGMTLAKHIDEQQKSNALSGMRQIEEYNEEAKLHNKEVLEEKNTVKNLNERGDKLKAQEKEWLRKAISGEYSDTFNTLYQGKLDKARESLEAEMAASTERIDTIQKRQEFLLSKRELAERQKKGNYYLKDIPIKENLDLIPRAKDMSVEDKIRMSRLRGKI